MPVLATVGVRGDGAQELLLAGSSPAAQALKAPVVAAQEAVALDASPLDAQTQVIRTHQQVHRLMELAVRAPQPVCVWMTASTPWCCTPCGACCCCWPRCF